MPQIEQDIVIDASPDKVWAVLGERFGDVALWAQSVHESRMIEPELRECRTILGTVRMNARIALKPVYGHVMMLLAAPRMRKLSSSLSDLKRYVEAAA